MPKLRPTFAIALLLVHACSAPSPEDRPCLRCSEVDTRDDERLLCPGELEEPAPYFYLLGCKCAPSAPCESACLIWCKGMGATEEPSCTACVAALCAPQRAACDADRP